MTDHVAPLVGQPLSSFMVVDKSRAILAARRHSARVRVLRIATIGGAMALGGGIVLFTLFNPFGGVDGVSIEGASLSGTKVTMASPRLSGYHKDGRPYTITASAAVQDIKVPTIFELRDLQARLTETDKSVTTVTAATGVYDSATEIMDLTSAVRITGESGLDVRAQDAQVSFKTSAVTTDKPVTVAMRGSTLSADRMHVVDGGKHVTFEGNVHSTMVPGGDPAVASIVPPTGAAP